MVLQLKMLVWHSCRFQGFWAAWFDPAAFIKGGKRRLGGLEASLLVAKWKVYLRSSWHIMCLPRALVPGILGKNKSSFMSSYLLKSL